MKIGFLSFALHGGGAERMVSRLANAFVEKGNEVTIYMMDTSDIAYALDERIRIVDSNIDYSQSRIKRRIQIIKALFGTIRRDIKKEQTEVLFAFLIAMVPFALLATWGVHCKVIGSERTNPKALTKFYKAVVKFVTPFCDGYVFQTKGAMMCYPAAVRKKATVIGNIVPKVAESNYDNRKKCGICSAGRLHTDKDYKTLLYAFEKVKQKYPEAALTIFGQGEQKEELETLCGELKIADSVFFDGFVKNLPERLCEFPIFAFSSKAEGMPNVLAEAMAAGLACVSADCEFGPSELIEDGKNGFLVPVGDSDKMAERLIWLLQHEEEGKKIGQEALLITEKFSEEKIVNRYLDYAEGTIRRK